MSKVVGIENIIQRENITTTSYDVEDYWNGKFDTHTY